MSYPRRESNMAGAHRQNLAKLPGDIKSALSRLHAALAYPELVLSAEEYAAVETQLREIWDLCGEPSRLARVRISQAIEAEQGDTDGNETPGADSAQKAA